MILTFITLGILAGLFLCFLCLPFWLGPIGEPQPSFERLLKMMESVPACISYIDRDLRYQFVNKTYEKWFGFSKAEILGKRVPELVGEVLYERIRPYLERALAGEFITYEIQDNLGTIGRRIFCVQFVPDFASGGSEVLGIVGHVSDVSDRIKVQEDLHKAKEAAEAADRAKSRFLASVSHDLRTPLGAIIGFAELLNSTDLSDHEKERYVETIKRNGRELARLVDKIPLAHSLPSTGGSS